MPTSAQLLAELKLLHPLLIDLSLGRVERLLAKLGDPHKRLPPVVHIAGTNGKGSVTAYLKAMLQAAGARVHVYTSPHLVRFHERIELAGADGKAHPIGEEQLVDVLVRTQATNGSDDITQFEITTAAAFLAFAEQPADVLLLEVGLGGRLDATNVVDRPALSVITPISMDHSEKLGATLAKIAYEKAGILRSGVPAVIAQQEPEAEDVIRAEAVRSGASLVVWGEQFDAFEQRGRLVVQTEAQLLDLPLPVLVGRHQIVNAGTAVAAALELRARLPGIALDEWAIEEGLTTARWPARMQRLELGSTAVAAEARVRAVARWRPQPRGRARARANARRPGRALAQAGASHRRHDGLEEFRRLPRALPRARAPRGDGAHSRRARGPARARDACGDGAQGRARGRVEHGRRERVEALRQD